MMVHTFRAHAFPPHPANSLALNRLAPVLPRNCPGVYLDDAHADI